MNTTIAAFSNGSYCYWKQYHSIVSALLHIANMRFELVSKFDT